MAADLASRYDAKLVLLSAFQGSGGGAPPGSGSSQEIDWATNSSTRVREILSRTENELKAKGIDCATRVDEGDPAEVLVALAAESDADILVIGNKGMHRRVLASVPNTVTHKAACSVLVVKTT